MVYEVLSRRQSRFELLVRVNSLWNIWSLFSSVAEHWSCKPGVGSSILSGGRWYFFQVVVKNMHLQKKKYTYSHKKENHEIELKLHWDKRVCASCEVWTHDPWFTRPVLYHWAKEAGHEDSKFTYRWNILNWTNIESILRLLVFFCEVLRCIIL